MGESETPEKDPLPQIDSPKPPGRIKFSRMETSLPERFPSSSEMHDAPYEKMVWMNESAVVSKADDVYVVGTRSLADCLGIGCYDPKAGVAGADHMRFDPTHDPEGDNIGYASGRLIYIATKVMEKGGKKPDIYIVNLNPKIRGEERNKRLKRVLNKALEDERLKGKIGGVHWIDRAEGFKINTRHQGFRSW